MKVLIADDEEHVREGIELSVDWERFGITERLMAEDGEQAMELIRSHRPAVLFCDMSMPGMDGTELLRLLREEGWETQVIVVSGYDSFPYTRAAIQAGGVDYLLKPFRKSDLEQALSRAVAVCRERESSQRTERDNGDRLRRADALLDEQKLAVYFKGEVAFHEGIRGLFYKVGLPTDRISAALVLPRNRMGLVEKRFYGDGELFVFAVNNIAHEALKPYGAHYLCRLDDYQWLLLTSAGSAYAAGDYRRYIDKLAEAWESTLGLQVLIGLSGSDAAVDSLPQAIGAARAALWKCDILRSGSDHDATRAQEPPRLTDRQILLQTALKNEDRAYAAEIIRSFADRLRERGTLSVKELQACTMEANLILEQASRLIGDEPVAADIFLPQWISDLDEWEKLLIQQWWRLMEETGGEGISSRGIQAIRDYMHRHFQQDLSLSVLSERFHFSPQYIAKKFKELYNTTVMTYLTELRMEKAKSLLIHTDMSVLDMAEALGYADENYFGKVFKKQTGLSPLQFRKQQRHS